MTDDIAQTLAACRDEVADLRDRLAFAESQVRALRDSELYRQLVAAEARLTEIVAENKRLQHRAEADSLSASAASAAHAKWYQRAMELERELAEARTERDGLDADYGNLVKEYESVSRELAEARQGRSTPPRGICDCGHAVTEHSEHEHVCLMFRCGCTKRRADVIAEASPPTLGVADPEGAEPSGGTNG